MVTSLLALLPLPLFLSSSLPSPLCLSPSLPYSPSRTLLIPCLCLYLSQLHWIWKSQVRIPLSFRSKVSHTPPPHPLHSPFPVLFCPRKHTKQRINKNMCLQNTINLFCVIYLAIINTKHKHMSKQAAAFEVWFFFLLLFFVSNLSYSFLFFLYLSVYNIVNVPCTVLLRNFLV